ncbi:MAG: SGNH/GDSL hydrolase family protein [Armatimonadetes bacterium]|nr:SGNH/GDSL hydrolase family protein [Candidatus Hippobium faecium]
MNLLNIFPYITGIGDSLMSGEVVTDKFDYIDSFDYAWLTYLCRRINAKCDILSYGGATCESWLASYSRKLYESRTKCPCYFICLGSNDFGQNYKIGTVNDKQEDKTYMGYYKTILDLLKGQNPYAYIFCCSMYNPEEDKNENGDTRGDFNKAVKSLTELYDQTYYLDFINQGEYILGEPDITLNGHYNTIGYYKVSFAFEKAANKVIEENIDDFKKAGLYDSFAVQYDHIRKNI